MRSVEAYRSTTTFGSPSAKPLKRRKADSCRASNKGERASSALSSKEVKARLSIGLDYPTISNCSSGWNAAKQRPEPRGLSGASTQMFFQPLINHRKRFHADAVPHF